MAFQSDAFQNDAFLVEGVVPPDPVVIDIDVDGLKKRDRDAEIFEQSRQASQEALRAAIERAFEGPKPDEPVTEPLSEPERQEMARLVLADMRIEGLTASLGRIEQLIAEYERQIEEEDEEAAIALLLMH